MTRQIPLTQGLVALVDDEDYDQVVGMGKWHAHVNPKCSSACAERKARVNGAAVHVRLHTVLTGWPLVDHINGNGLDNRRANLRPATTAQNTRNAGPRRTNTSGYKGVTRGRGGRGWYAQIGAEGDRHHLGTFPDPESAARAYDSAAVELHGEFARLNFPDETPAPMAPRPVPPTQRTHCPRGHEYTPENTRRSGNSRSCRTCHRDWARARRAANRAVAS